MWFQLRQFLFFVQRYHCSNAPVYTTLLGPAEAGDRMGGGVLSFRPCYPTGGRDGVRPTHLENQAPIDA